MIERYSNSAPVQELVGDEAIRVPEAVAHYDIPVLNDSDKLEGVQMLHFSVAEPENPHAVILTPARFSDFGKRDGQELRTGAMAAGTGARVIHLDFPGMGDQANGRGNELTERQQEALKLGRMQEIAKLYWQVLQEQGMLTDKDGSPLPIALWGDSLSTLTASELAASLPEGHTLADLYLSEHMALQEQSALTLGKNFLINGGRDDALYNSMNIGKPEVPTNWSMTKFGKQLITQRQSHKLSVQALARGQGSAILDEAINDGRVTPDTKIHLVTAEYGLVDPAAAQAFHDSIRTLDVHRQELNGEGHGYQIALPNVLQQASRLAIHQTRRL